VVERAVILAEGDVIELHDLPEELNRLLPGQNSEVQLGGDFSLEELEHEHIRRVVRRVPKRKEAAAILGIDAVTLYRKRKRFGF
jgi:two-component system, NtrC family, response regulator AlgB